MAQKRIAEIRRKLSWYYAFALGAALAFAVLVGVTAFVPGAGNNLLVWGTVFGFCALVVLVFAAVSWRLRSIERDVISSRSDLKNTGQLLAEQVARREKAEASLREEELFPELYPGPVLRFDNEGRVVRVNGAANELIGGPALQGRLLTELMPGMTLDDVRQCIRAGVIEPRQVEWGRRWYICHMRGVPGHATGVLYASDITENKELEEDLRHQERRARAILDGAADAIIIVAVGGIVQAVNPAMEKLFGWKHDEIVGRNVDLLLPELFQHHAGDRLQVLAGYARRKSTGPFDRVWYGRHRDGADFPISFTVSAYDYEGSPRVSLFVRDISERVRAQQLEKQQALQLQQQNLQLERLVSELDEFNYVASHDLQEPLRTMSTYCGLLRADLGGNLPKRAEEDVSAILSASLRMQRLITDLLEYSRSSHREIRMAEVDLQLVMQRVIGDLKARILESGGRVEYDGLPRVRGDDMQLGRVFQNLVANGLKFHRPGVQPVVTIRSEEADGCVRVEVCDNGIGIEQQYLNQIFQPFKRLHGIGKYEGSGIGLSVCRKIVERHGGSIEVSSTPGEGSRFKLKFPAAKGAPTESGEA
ncbi:MAG: PAS domain S-box protein [Planctomycetes bacterium]|nr:PAS domain S-box protein [Planctomycetota bacterium]